MSFLVKRQLWKHPAKHREQYSLDIIGSFCIYFLSNSETHKIPVYKSLIKRIVPRFIWTSLNNYKLIRHDIKAGKILEENILKFNPDLIYERSEYLQDSGAILANKYKIKYFIELRIRSDK